MADNPEVRVQLLVDDQSEATLDKVKEGFVKTDEQAKVTNADVLKLIESIDKLVQHQAGMGKGGEDLSKAVLKGNAEFKLLKIAAKKVKHEIVDAVEKMRELGEEAMKAAEAQEKQERQMAGYLFLMDKGQHSMLELKNYTHQQREEFEKFGIHAGISVGSLVTAYDKLIERGSMSSEKAKNLTEQMAIVGKVVPGGMEALAQGMSGVEMGMVRARNPIVQLIAATHMLEGNSRDVARQMMKMTPEKQMEIAERAIAKQAEALKKMGGGLPPTMDKIRTSFAGMQEGFFESMGEPAMNMLIPQLVKLRDYLEQHMDQIKEFGERIGETAGRAIEYVSGIVQDIYAGFSVDLDGVNHEFNEMSETWSRVWHEVTGDVDGIDIDFHKIGTELHDVFIGIMKVVKEAAGVVMDAKDMWSNVRPFTTAGVTDLLSGDNPFANIRDVGFTRAKVSGDELSDAADNTTITPEAFQAKIAEYREAADEIFSPEVIDTFIGNMQSFHDRMIKQGDDISNSTEADVGAGDWDKVAADLQRSRDSKNDEELAWQLDFIAHNNKAVQAIAIGKTSIAAGFDEFIAMLQVKSPQLAAILKAAQDPLGGGKGVVAPTVNQTFHGGIHIKQDFKDQDPDRVLLVFRKDLAQQAANRTSARTGSAFGW